MVCQTRQKKVVGRGGIGDKGIQRERRSSRVGNLKGGLVSSRGWRRNWSTESRANKGRVKVVSDGRVLARAGRGKSRRLGTYPRLPSRLQRHLRDLFSGPCREAPTNSKVQAHEAPPPDFASVRSRYFFLLELHSRLSRKSLGGRDFDDIENCISHP
jgi:hypothetical protein